MGPIEVSVVIPALNAVRTIGEQLDALASQVVDVGWEVLVIDNGSTDGTAALCREYEGTLPIRLLRCERPGTSAARNAGARGALGAKLLFCDADDRVAPGWVMAMRDALEVYDAVGGSIENQLLNQGRKHSAHHPEGLPVVAGFLPRSITANLGVRKEVWKVLGGFAEDYDYGSDDTEFSWRLQLASYTLGYAPAAVVHYRHRTTLRSVIIKAYRTGHSRGRLFREYHRHGMPRPRFLGAAARWVRIVGALPVAAVSTRVRWWWVDQAGAAAGRLVGSLRFGVRYL